MGNGVETVPRIVVNRFTAFGMHRIGFPLLAKTLPPPKLASTACSASTSSEATS